MKNQTILRYVFTGLSSTLLTTALISSPATTRAAGGDVLWTNQFNLSGGRDQALAVAAKGRGVFVAGRVRNATLNDDWRINAYDAVSGSLLWTNQLDVAGGRDEALSVAVAGKVVAAAGRVRNGSLNDDWLVRAYDAGIGSLLWQDLYDATNGNDRANAIVALGKSVVAVGRVRNSAGNDDWFVRAYDATTGALRWQDQLDLVGDNDEAVAVTIQGTKVFAVGHVTNGAGDSDWYVRAYNLVNGAVLWTNQFDKVAGDDAALAVVARGKSVFVAGYVVNGAGDEDWEVRAYDAGTGNLLWEDQHDLAADDDRAVSLAVRGHSVVVAGSVRNLAGDSDFAVRTYDTGSGNLLWEDRYNPAGGNDAALATTVSGSTALIVGRVTNAQGDTDWFVRAYSVKAGAQLWSDQVNPNGGDDEAFGVATAGNRAIVVGDVENAAGNADWSVRTSAVK
ncbi:MAG: PQQ-binding-like beta-propeller repeat protein [Verrucomicrobia bacterium]|nr:PQQ-binding-like beta-propeller repeat protein [Verrucomicrobiota bacterium]